MIEYKYPEEKAITFHYAQQFNDSIVLAVLEKGYAENSNEAHHLARFFWRMTDQTVIDIEKKKDAAGYENLKSCCAYITQSFHSYFMRAGYSREWDDESDNAQLIRKHI